MIKMTGVDAELLNALKVIRATTTNTTNNNDMKKNGSVILKAIVSAIESQEGMKGSTIKTTTTTIPNNGELIDSIEKLQNLLESLVDHLGKKHRVDAAISALAKKATATANKEAKKKVITGPWAFVESAAALKRRDSNRSSIDNNNNFSQKDILKMEDALFGKSNESADVLSGDSFGECWDRMRTPIDPNGQMKPPKWSTTLDKKKNKKQNNNNFRSYLPTLSIGGETEIKLYSGIYYFTIHYENNQIGEGHNEAAIIIGEMAFDSRGYVTAAGADWNKLFGGDGGGEQQIKVKKARRRPSIIGRKSAGHKKLKWSSSKISDAWKDGDTLNFKIDTNTNSVVYTIQGANDKDDVCTGMKLSNILSFTNNHTYPKFLQVFAYCGGGTSLFSSNKNTVPKTFEGVKFTLKETHRTCTGTTSTSDSSSSENKDNDCYAAIATVSTVDTADMMSLQQSSSVMSYEEDE